MSEQLITLHVSNFTSDCKKHSLFTDGIVNSLLGEMWHGTLTTNSHTTV